MQDGAALLDSPIVPPPDNFAAMHYGRADRNATFPQTLPGLFDRGFEEWVGHTDIIVLIRLLSLWRDRFLTSDKTDFGHLPRSSDRCTDLSDSPFT
jgi:hypothetical protein